MTSVRSTRGRGVLLHLLLLRLLLFFHSSSSLQRSPARKKARVNSRSPSPADDNPHSASRTAYPASHRDHLSLFAGNDDKFNSHSEDNQDLAPDTLRHSGLWSLVDDNPHSASRTAYPASHRDHLSLFAGNDDEFNSHSEDNQDLAPDTLRHSGLWSLVFG